VFDLNQYFLLLICDGEFGHKYIMCIKNTTNKTTKEQLLQIS